MFRDRFDPSNAISESTSSIEANAPLDWLAKRAEIGPPPLAPLC